MLKVNPAELKLKKEFEGKTATWHDPCHLVRYQNIKDQPRFILKGLKGLKYVEMPNADMCCGMGGTFSVYHYDISKKIADNKMEGIKAGPPARRSLAGAGRESGAALTGRHI